MRIALGALLCLLATSLFSADSSRAARCLQESYPDFIARIENNRLHFHDGSSMLFDDGRAKSPKEAFQEADLEDQFTFAYPLGRDFGVPLQGEDSSRWRSVEFFKKLYGTSEAEVRAKIRALPWLPALQSGVFIEVTTVNGIDKRLERISERIERLPSTLRAPALNPAGGFVWRVIAGTNLPSVHSFGAAIDLDVSFSHYWRWDLERLGKARYENRIPLEIVEIFESEGFIWGGKWGHYDTMHFEYRPEILCFSR